MDRTARREAGIVHYNTPELAEAAIRSLWKQDPGIHVTVLDNSGRRPFPRRFAAENTRRLTVVDNTKGAVVDFGQWLREFPERVPSRGNDYGSAKHCFSVQWLCDWLRAPFLLMDPDVLVFGDVGEFFMHPDCAWVGQAGENVKRRFGYDFKRVIPFLCWLNVPLMKRRGISYFNGDWMWDLSGTRPNNIYDTGAWFHRAVSEAGLATAEVDLRRYILHLGHGSWRDPDGARARTWLEVHRGVWE